MGAGGCPKARLRQVVGAATEKEKGTNQATASTGDSMPTSVACGRMLTARGCNTGKCGKERLHCEGEEEEEAAKAAIVAGLMTQPTSSLGGGGRVSGCGMPRMWTSVPQPMASRPARASCVAEADAEPGSAGVAAAAVSCQEAPCGHQAKQRAKPGGSLTTAPQAGLGCSVSRGPVVHSCSRSSVAQKEKSEWGEGALERESGGWGI